MKHQNANITRNVSCVPGLPVHAGSTKARSVHGIQPTGDAPNPQDDEWSPYLVGGWALHIWKMMEWVTVGMMTFPKKWKVLKAMFQSTNQVLLLVGGKRLVTFGVLVESPWEAWARHLGFKFIQPAKSMQDMKEQGVQVTNSVVFLGLLVITPLLHMPICDILGMCCARQSSARTSNLFLLVCGLLSCLKMMERERVARRLKPKNPTHGCWCCFIKCVTEYWFNIRRPRPSPRQGRRLGPPEVWNLLCHGHGTKPCCSSVAACPLPAHSPLLLGRSSLPFASLQTLNTLRRGIRLPGFKHLKLLKPSRSLAAASTKPSDHQPLLFQGCSLPFACT